MIMEEKKWYQSKTVWGIVLLLVGLAMTILNVSSGAAVTLIGLALSLLGLRTANAQLVK